MDASVPKLTSGKTHLACSFCSSQLTAKKGKIKQHHFAHTGETCLRVRKGKLPSLPLYDHFHLQLSAKHFQLLKQTLYFLEIQADGKTLHKIGVTQRTIGGSAALPPADRLKEIERDLKKRLKIVTKLASCSAFSFNEVKISLFPNVSNLVRN